jgi:hypothetical protein
LKSYSVDLLRWWRFLDAVGGGVGPGVTGGGEGFQLLDPADGQAAAADVLAAGGPVILTGAGSGYAPSTVAHSETVLRRFYDFHRDWGPARC